MLLNCRRLRLALLSAACTWGLTAHAATDILRAVDIPAGDLTAALETLAKQSGVELVYRPEQLRGLRTRGAHGNLSSVDAVNKLIAGTTLIVRRDASGVLLIVPPGGPTDAGTRSVSTNAGESKDTNSAPSGDRLRPAPKNQAVPEAAPSVERKDLEEVVVTGTNIRGTSPVGSELITLNRRDIDQSGYATTPQLIQSLSQNSGLGANEANFSRSTVQNAYLNGTGGTAANLRGLGPLSTLVLINGRRLAPSGSGTFADVGIIPLSAVERVEIMPDGASAIYGSDAIGGVINFTLRHDFNGAESSVRYGVADGFHQVQLSQLVGTTWSTGSALLSYDFERRGELAADKRAYFTQDLRPFGGHDFRTSFSNPGTIISNGVPYAIPAHQNGSALAPSDLIPGQFNLQDQDLGTTILPERTQNSLMGAVRQEIAPWLSLFAEGYYTNRKVEQSIAASGSILNVPASNPFFVSPLAGATSELVQYSFLDDIGATGYTNSVQNYTVTVGGEASLGGDWHARLNGSYGMDDETIRLDNIVNNARLAMALADPAAATAFNPFGDGSHTNPATLLAIRGYNHGTAKYDVKSVNFTVDGPVLSLPSGPVRVALGAEHREEALESQSTSLQDSLTPIVSSSRLSRNVNAIYSELRLPLVGAEYRRPGLESIELSVAGRYESYTDFGSKATPKIGLTWEPSRDLGLRASWGRSFQAPALRQLTNLSAAYLVAPLVDPSSPTGRTLTLLYSAPGNPELESQTARTWSVGADLHPRALPGLKLGVTYFDINYQNLIGSIGSNLLNALQLESIYAPLIIRNPSAAFVQSAYASGLLIGPPVDPAMVGAYVNAAPTNLGGLKQSGIDFSFSDSLLTSAGQLGFHSNFTRLLKYDVAQTSVAPFMDMLNTIDNPINFRARTGATWGRGPASAAVFLNYVAGYRNNTVTPVQNVSSWTTFDLQASYLFPDDITLSVQGQNIFNRAPPFVDSSSYGYDPTAASAIGRYVSLSVRKKW